MHRVVRNWKVILEDTVKAVQEMALRGEEYQSCKASAIAFNYNGGCVHTFPRRETHPKVSDFLLTHFLERDKLSKNHKESF